MSEALSELSSYLREMRGDLFLDASISHNELNVTAAPETILALLTFLRDDARCGFISMIDICGVDWPQREKRFDVVYHLLSPKQNLRIRIKVAVADGESVPSATAVYQGAEWFEREAWDMYGIPFSGHADLRRLLTDYGFDGHPLRKDFPTTGYVEVRYDDTAKRVVYEPVELKQEFRNFDFMSPWEGTDYVLPGDEKAAK
ncbi:NADH-quinone oxidoreductase subunit C [Rhizobium sp. 007]|uniref:NADH-quinone oxidoreductase subunit C n=1 Tax=Rhizobium sp. 007 TaxID=2785056 RepID=UPI00188DCF9E|nr:NADH-quinone oxidoreductase subunit C [Rhizobium sp. 007]QPB20933.1 NADH-quinone oxidoreductase subunit C [Rhizobium sp. 007]